MKRSHIKGSSAVGLTGCTDVEKLKRMSDEEITRNALRDPNAQPLSDYQLSKMKPMTPALKRKLGL
jgi:hypothetical protein